MIHKNHLYRVTEFAVGLIFGMGLMLSGMTDPGKVIGFLDLDRKSTRLHSSHITISYAVFCLKTKRR